MTFRSMLAAAIALVLTGPTASAGQPTASRPSGEGARAGVRARGADESGEAQRRGARLRGGGVRTGERPRRQGLDAAEHLTAEQTQELLDFASRHFPRVHERLLKARESEPAAFPGMLRRAAGMLLHLQEMEKRNPVLAEKMIAQQKAEMKILDLRRAYTEASSDAEREQLRRALRGELETRFTLRLERLKVEVEDLRRRLDEQTRRLTEQEQRREQMIRRELESLVGERRTPQ